MFLVLSLLPSQGFLRARSGLTFHALENGINVAPCHLLSQVFILPEQVRRLQAGAVHGQGRREVLPSPQLAYLLLDCCLYP